MTLTASTVAILVIFAALIALSVWVERTNRPTVAFTPVYLLGVVVSVILTAVAVLTR